VSKSDRDFVLETLGIAEGKTGLNVRARAGQIAFWAEAAEASGMTLSAWVKQVLTNAANTTFAELDAKFGDRTNAKQKP
jgi:uncharacterized protein (DUF1778 family)